MTSSSEKRGREIYWGEGKRRSKGEITHKGKDISSSRAATVEVASNQVSKIIIIIIIIIKKRFREMSGSVGRFSPCVPSS